MGLLVGAPPACGQETLSSFFDPQRNTYFWLRHLEGRQIGDVSSFTSAGGTRYGWQDNGVVLLTGQGLMTNNGDGGANVGATRRLWLTEEAIVGFGLWGDLTTSRNENVFHQGGLSFEVLGDLWSVRANWYQPIGSQVRNVSYVGLGTPGGLSFMGSHLISGEIGYRHDEIAMGGADVSLARSISDYAAEAFVGYYNLQGPIGEQAHGIQGGLRGYLTNSLAATASVSYDDLFGTNVFGGLTWYFGSGGASPRTLDDKLTSPVHRHEQIVVRDVGTYHDDYLTLTRGGTPIKIAHVDSNGTGGDGTAEAPFESLLDAVAADADVIYVHADSSFTGASVVLQPGQRLLGEGPSIVHLVESDQLGLVGLPRATSGTMLPVIQSPLGPALVLADGVEVAGFRIAGGPLGLSAGSAVTGPVNVHDISLVNIDRGIDIVGSSGQFDFSRVTIENAASSGILIQGGSAETRLDDVHVTTTNGPGLVLENTGRTTISGATTIDATGGPALDVTDSQLQATFQSLLSTNSASAGIRLAGVLPGSSLSVTDSVVLRGAAGNGVEILNSAGDFTFADLEIDGTGGAGILVFGSPGARVDFGATSITRAGTEGIVLNSNPGAFFEFETMDVESLGGHGLFASNSGTVNINSVATSILAQGGAAVFLNGTLGQTSGVSGWTFDSLLSENSSAEGIALLNLTDDFAVRSSTTVRNAASHGIFVFHAAAGRTFTFGGLTSVDGTASGAAGIAIDQTAADVQFEDLLIRNAGSSGVALGALGANTGLVRILGGSVESAGSAAGLFVRNSNVWVRDVRIDGGTSSLEALADGGSVLVNVEDSQLLNATLRGVRLTSMNAGQLQARVAHNILDTSGVDSLEATVSGPGSVLSIDVDENQAILGAPDGSFHFAQSGAGDLNVAQADAADVSNRNHGVNVSTSGTVDFNQP